MTLSPLSLSISSDGFLLSTPVQHPVLESSLTALQDVTVSGDRVIKLNQVTPVGPDPKRQVFGCFKGLCLCV